MSWVEKLFEWADREPSAYRVSRYTFDVSLAAVQDKFNRVPITDPANRRDFAACGDGILTQWRDQLWTTVPMVFSDRVSDGRAGDIENWYLTIGRRTEAVTVLLPWWPDRLTLDDVAYVDRGGQFVSGFLDSPSGVWHIALSLDRQTSDPAFVA